MSDVDRLNLRTSRMRPLRYLERAAKPRRAVVSGPACAGLKAPPYRLCTGLLVCAAMVTSEGGVRAGGKEWSKGGRPAQDRPRHDPVVETLAADAAGVAPEFAADALIRIASSPRVTDPAWRRELLDEAYMRAYAAQEQYRRSSTQAIPPDSRQGAPLAISRYARADTPRTTGGCPARRKTRETSRRSAA